MSDDADELIAFLGETMNNSTANGVAQVLSLEPNLIPNPNPSPEPNPYPNPNLNLTLALTLAPNPPDANPSSYPEPQNLKPKLSTLNSSIFIHT